MITTNPTESFLGAAGIVIAVAIDGFVVKIPIPPLTDLIGGRLGEGLRAGTVAVGGALLGIAAHRIYRTVSSSKDSERNTPRMADPAPIKGQFQLLAIQYYIAGRAAFELDLAPAMGSLFHHAIECLLKSCLVDTIPVAELKRVDTFGHDLQKLWSAFKQLDGVSGLDHFDDVIDDLHAIGHLRYPAIGYQIFTHPTKKARSDAVNRIPLKDPVPEYHFVLESIDELWSAMIRTRMNPEWIKMVLKPFPRQLEQYRRDNPHSCI